MKVSQGMLRFVIVSLGAAALFFIEASSAHAQRKRIVVESFYGPQAGQFRSLLVQNLSERSDLELVDPTELRDAVRDLGFEGRRLGEQEYAQIARRLQINAFIDGSVARRGRQWALTVRVYNGYDGLLIGDAGWSGRTMASLRRVRRNGFTKLAPFLAVARSPQPAPASPRYDDGPGEEVPEEEFAEADEAEDDEKDEMGFEEEDVGAVGEIEYEEEVDEEFGGDEPTFNLRDAPALRGAGESKRPGPTAFSVALVGGILKRSLTTPAVVYNLGRDPRLGPLDLVEEERSYSGGPLGHSELGFEVQVYPGAFLSDPIVPWLGLVASYRHSLFLSLSSPPCSGRRGCPSDEVVVETSQSELYLGARARIPLTKMTGRWFIVADAGYGELDFLFGLDDLDQVERSSVLPPMRYRYAHLGAGMSMRVLPKYLTVTARAAYRPVLDIGAEAKSIWGQDTSTFDGYSFELELQSNAPYIAKGAFFRLNAQFFQFNTKFSGQATCVQPASGTTCDDPQFDLWEQWPVDADDSLVGGLPETVEDTYFRLNLALGWAFR